MAARKALAVALLAALATSGVSSLAQGHSDRPRSQVWPQAGSDVEADPAIVFGVLPNGMRYAVMRNARPSESVSLRLRFDVGSLMERERERGLAHFLEHMAFEGSAAFPGRGESIEILQRNGVAFGADSNAQTSFGATTYSVDLPRADEASIGTGLSLLREIAGNLTLSASGIAAERGVILAEERALQTPSYRALQSQSEFFMKGELAPQRFPIGQDSVIRAVDHSTLSSFYRRYYRPERATLVAVGDFDPSAMVSRIRLTFGDWLPKGPPGSDPQLGAVKRRQPAARVQREAGLDAKLTLVWVARPDRADDSLATRASTIRERLALAILNRRLARLADGPDPPFASAAMVSGDEVKSIHFGGVVVQADPNRIRQGLLAAGVVVRRALRDGVQPDELVRAIADERLGVAATVTATRDSRAIANEIAGSLDSDLVVTSPQEDLLLFEATAKAATPANVSEALSHALRGSGPLLFVQVPRQPQRVAEIRAALKDILSRPVPAMSSQVAAAWPYLSFGRPGTVVKRVSVSDLGVSMVRFANGVGLTFKPTTLQKGQVLVKLRFGGGRSTLRPDQPSLMWAGDAFVEGGFAKISLPDADVALAGRAHHLGFALEDDAVTLTAESRAEDLAFVLQEMTAYFSDPGWRLEAFQRQQAAELRMLSQDETSAGGVAARDFDGLLHNGDRRWTSPTPSEVAAAKLPDVRRQFDREASVGPVVVVVVGDVDFEKTVAEVANTLGALPDRASPPERSQPPPSFPEHTHQPRIEAYRGRGDQAIAFIAWPTQGYFQDPRGAMADTVLAEVLRLRLFDRLRLKEGISYTPTVHYSASETWPWGFVEAQAEVTSDNVARVFSDVGEIASDLVDAPPGPDELERAKKPRLDALEQARSTNDFWLEGLSGAQDDPRRLDVLRFQNAALGAVTAEDVMKAARAWLSDDKAWKLVVEPSARAGGR